MPFTIEISNHNLKNKTLPLPKGLSKPADCDRALKSLQSLCFCWCFIPGEIATDIFYLGNDHVSDAFAVSFHSEDLVVVAGGDVELDFGAAAVRVVAIRGCDGGNRVSQGGVLCEGLSAVLSTDAQRSTGRLGKPSKGERTAT